MDGFDEDEPECEGDEGAEVPVCLLAAQRDALEALELADQLLDPSASPVERFREERRSALGRPPVRDHRADAALARGRTVALGVVALVAHGSTGRDLGPKLEQDLELTAVAGFASGQLESQGQTIEIDLEVDLARKAAAGAAECLTLLPPFAPAAETCARTTVESNI